MALVSSRSSDHSRTLGVYRHRTVKGVIDAAATAVPQAPTEIHRFGRALKQGAADILAFFDPTIPSNGPTEAISERLEHLRGSAFGLFEPHQVHRTACSNQADLDPIKTLVREEPLRQDYGITPA